MATKRLRVLTRSELATLPRWQQAGPPMAGVGLTGAGRRTAAVVAELHDADAVWAAAAIEHYGLVGVQAVNRDAPDAYVLVTPALAVPGDHPSAASGRTPAACVLLALWTHPDYAPAGLARQVVGHLAGKVSAVASCLEAVADPASGRAAAGPLLPARALLEDVGFRPTDDEHPYGVVMRLDLDATVREPRFGWAMPAWAPWQGRPEPAPIHTGGRHATGHRRRLSD